MIKDLELYKQYKESILKISDVIDKELGNNSKTKKDYDLCKGIINSYLEITDSVLDGVVEVLFDMDISTSNRTAKNYKDFMPVEKILFSAVSSIIYEFDSEFLGKLDEKDFNLIHTDQNFNIIIFSMDTTIQLLFTEILDYLINNKILEPHNFLEYSNNLDLVKLNTLYTNFHKN